MGAAPAARALERFPEDRCTERTEEVYRFWLERPPERQRSTNGSRSIAAAASSASTKSHGTR